MFIIFNHYSFWIFVSWNRVSPGDYDKVVALAAKLFPQAASECGGFLRHKANMILPSVLKAHHINFDVVRQKPGKFLLYSAF